MRKEENIFRKGFTLIELLIVIAVMAVLSSVIFVALDPLVRYQEARNTRRWNDVNAISVAFKLHQTDNDGVYYPDIEELETGQAFLIGKCADASSIACTDPDVTLAPYCIDISWYAEEGGYLSEIPIDPLGEAQGANYLYTGYYFIKNDNKSMSVGSCFEELGNADEIREITVSR